MILVLERCTCLQYYPPGVYHVSNCYYLGCRYTPMLNTTVTQCIIYVHLLYCIRLTRQNSHKRKRLDHNSAGGYLPVHLSYKVLYLLIHIITTNQYHIRVCVVFHKLVYLFLLVIYF